MYLLFWAYVYMVVYIYEKAVCRKSFYFDDCFTNSNIPPNEPETTDEIVEDVKFVKNLIQSSVWEKT